MKKQVPHYTGFVGGEPIDLLYGEYSCLEKLRGKPSEKPYSAANQGLTKFNLDSRYVESLLHKRLIKKTGGSMDSTVWDYEITLRGQEWWRNSTHRMRKVLRDRSESATLDVLVRRLR